MRKKEEEGENGPFSRFLRWHGEARGTLLSGIFSAKQWCGCALLSYGLHGHPLGMGPPCHIVVCPSFVPLKS